MRAFQAHSPRLRIRFIVRRRHLSKWNNLAASAAFDDQIPFSWLGHFGHDYAFRRFRRHRINRPALIRKLGLVRLLVRETLAGRALDRKRRTFPVLDAKSGAMIVSEIVFRQITVKVFFIAMLIDALHASFED